MEANVKAVGDNVERLTNELAFTNLVSAVPIFQANVLNVARS